MLEFAADEKESGKYPYIVNGQKFITFDWHPMIECLLTDLKNNITVEIISAKFHNTLADMILAAVKHFDRNKILLSGGCFQNAVLLTKTIKLLEDHGFKVYTHQRIPPNDGGISVGQIAAAYYLVGSFNEEIM